MRVGSLLVGLTLVAAACGSDDDAATTTDAPADTEAPAVTEAPADRRSGRESRAVPMAFFVSAASFRRLATLPSSDRLNLLVLNSQSLT